MMWHFRVTHCILAYIFTLSFANERQLGLGQLEFFPHRGNRSQDSAPLRLGG